MTLTVKELMMMMMMMAVMMMMMIQNQISPFFLPFSLNYAALIENIK